MSRTLTTHTTVGINLSTFSSANDPFTIATTGAITPTTGDALVAKGGASYNWTIDNFGTITSTPSTTHAIYLGPGVAINSGTIINESGGRISSGGYGIVINGAGSVTNKAGGTISAAVFKAIYLIGTGTVVNAGVMTAGNVAVYEGNGGVITNQSGGTISGNGGVWFESPGTFTNYGVVIGTNAGFGAVLFNSTSAPNRFIDEAAGTITGNIIAQIGGTDVIELASAVSTGTLSGFGTSITNFDTVQFDTGAKWMISGNSAGLSGLTAITGFGANDTIDLTGFAAVSATFASNALTLTNAATAHTTLHLQGTFTSSEFHLSAYGGTGTSIVLCFAEGTHIATPEGARPVEELAVGEVVLAHFAGSAPIQWIGRRDIDCARHREPESVWPVRVAAGAFGPGVPARDLLLSPNHAVYVSEVLIPIKRLINGSSIAQVRMDQVTYYHVELAQHDLLLTEGVLTESYLDAGDRETLGAGDAPMRLFPHSAARPVDVAKLWEAYGCAPLVVHGPELEAARCRVNGLADGNAVVLAEAA